MGMDFYTEYVDSVYGQANDLTPLRFEAAAEGFKAQYGSLLPKNKQAHILDAGCGAGHFLYFLEKCGYVNFQGIDISPQQIEHCRAHVTSRVASADIYDYLDGKICAYDFIVAHDILEHVPKDRVVVLTGKFFAALKPGGVLVVRVPNMSNPLSVHARYVDLTHELGFTERSLRQLLYLGGFRDITLKGAMMIRKTTWRSYLRRLFLKVYYAWVKFLYYVQDFSVPTILDHDLLAIGRKNEVS
ncbi:MAG: class I SAM-dependent methyltransferase [Candidatus Omnitrophota bacterium]